MSPATASRTSAGTHRADPAKAPRIGLLSPCGWGNLGDAAIIQAVIEATRARWPAADLFALTLNPADTEARHGIPTAPLAAYSLSTYPIAGQAGIGGVRSACRAAWRELSARRRDHSLLEGCDLLVVAGGGQLDDYWGGAWGHPYVLWKWAHMARRQGVPMAILSTGYGPARNVLSRRFLRTTVRMAAVCSVRDRGSYDLTQALGSGAQLEIRPDLAFGLAPPEEAPREAGPWRVGVSPMAFADPRVWPERDLARYQLYLSRLADVVRRCVLAGDEVHLFSTDGPDRRTVRELADLAGDTAPVGRVLVHDTTTVSDLLPLLARLDAVVASRLHGVILAMVAARPVVAISYERKVDRVMQDFDIQRYALPINAFEPEDVMTRLARARGERSAIEGLLLARLAAYRAELNAQYVLVFDAVRSRG